MYDEEIARSLADISERMRDSQTVKTPTFYSPQSRQMVPQSSGIGNILSDGAIVKVGIIFAFVLLGYMIIRSGDGYRYSGRRRD